MKTESPQSLPLADRMIIPRSCPSCRCALVRERRRLVDRLYSLFQPVKRYRCQNFACQWVGNFARTKDTRDVDPPPHRVPVAFVVHMALVAVGVVVVIVFSNLEPTSWADEGESQWGSLDNDNGLATQNLVQTPSR